MIVRDNLGALSEIQNNISCRNGVGGTLVATPCCAGHTQNRCTLAMTLADVK